MRGAAGCGSSSARRPASARRSRCWARRRPRGSPAARSSSATSSRTAAPRPRGWRKASSGCRRCRSRTAASCGRNSISTRRSSAGPGFCSSTSSRTRTSSAASPPPRHPKRWQDIEELLDAGINVWTTLNVQHLESLNDLVAQITGVKQRETLPDRVFDEADEVELIDLPPDDLLARLHAGKVYVPDEVGTAVERFFRKPNLIALRELALRRMTDRVEAAARVSLAGDRTSREWLAQDRAARRRRPRCASRAARARRQAACRCAARRMDRRVRRDAGAAAPVGAGAQPPHRSVASRGVARRRNRHARRADGGRSAHRVRADAARDAHHRRRAEAARLARAVAPLDGDRALLLGAKGFDVVTVAPTGATAPANGRRSAGASRVRAARAVETLSRGRRDLGRRARPSPSACSRTSSSRISSWCTCSASWSRACASAGCRRC